MRGETATHYHARLHALDLSTGKELHTATMQSPVTIQATYPKMGGTLTFNLQIQRGRPALLLAPAGYIGHPAHVGVCLDRAGLQAGGKQFERFSRFVIVH
jgi:hypothetical protein